MELLFVLGIVAVIVAYLVVKRRKDHSVEVAATPVVTVADTVTVSVVEAAPAVVEPTLAPVVVEAVPESTPAPAEKPKRAKTPEGKFIKDDPSTPENEAWVGGVAPAKKPREPKAPAMDKPKAPRKPRSKKV